LKTIGLLGGMSWESTATCYRLINEFVKARLGGLHSAKIVLASVDFHEIEGPMHAGDWDRVGAADSALPLFDTTALHARAAVGWALSAPP
jgi:aspartate/glutamate racemase